MSDRPLPTLEASIEGRQAIRQMRGWAVFVGVVVVVSQSVLGGIFYLLHDQARDRCVDGNRIRAAIAGGFDEQRRVLIAASQRPDEPPPTAEQQRAVDAYNEGIDRLIAQFDPVDC